MMVFTTMLAVGVSAVVLRAWDWVVRHWYLHRNWNLSLNMTDLKNKNQILFLRIKLVMPYLKLVLDILSLTSQSGDMQYWV